MTGLLIRDLAQVATPAGTGGPLRGAALRDVSMVEDAYVLCAAGAIESVGRMRELARELSADVERSTAAGCARYRGSSTATPMRASAVIESTSSRSGRAARRTRSFTRPAAASSRRCGRRVAQDEAELARITMRHRGWMLAHGTTTFEGKSGYGLDHDTELAQLRAIRAAGGVPTWLGAHTVPPEFATADAYVDFLLEEVLPEAARIAEAADVFLERGSFDAAQARRYLEACADAGLALRLHGDQFTESGAIALAIELGARSVDHLERPGPAGVARLAASDVTGVLLPASALFLARPMPPARELADAGGLIALATDFNPGSAFCDSLPLVLSLACTQLHLAPEEALVAATVNAAHVLGRADRIGRLSPGFTADIVLLEALDWRHVAYHLAGDVVDTVIEGGAVAYRRTA